MKLLVRIAAAACIALAFGGCRPQAVEPCGNDTSFQVICHVEDPDDIARVEGTDWILASQSYGGTVKAPFALINARTLLLKAPRFEVVERSPGDSRGDPNCDGPPPRPRFRGIDVQLQDDGRYVVAGISGSELQRVEIYEARAGDDGMTMTWAGCVEVPSQFFLNDVAIGPERAIYAVHMASRASGLKWAVLQLKYILGDETGFAVQWKPDQGWRRVTNSAASLPNGISYIKSQGAIYMTSTYSSSMIRIDLANGRRKEALLPVRPDNFSISESGSLVIAGNNGVRLISTAGCGELSRPGCAFPFGIVEMEADLSHYRTIFMHDAAKIPGASSVVRVGNMLFLGTSAGDRITVVTP